MLLTDAGFALTHHLNRDEVLQSIECGETDLLLVDVCTDARHGFELGHRLRQGCMRRDIPLVFLGDSSELENRLESFRCGAIDYLPYPFLGDEIIARLRNHISVFSVRRELKSVQEELRLSKDSLKLAHTIARLGHWEWELASDVVRWSDEAYRILGFEPRECRPSHELLFRRVHPDERELVAAHIEQVRESGRFDLEFRIQMPDGHSRILQGRGQIACLVDCRYPHVIDEAQAMAWGPGATFIGVIQDVTERKMIEQQLEVEAHTDELTGAASRRYFLELAQHAIDKARQPQGQLSLLMLDLDEFKKINDRYGHQTGDLTLQTLTETCQKQLRAEDVIGRLGGEEFAVLLPGATKRIALDVAERLRSSIEESVVPVGGGVRFTASIGVALLARDELDIDSLLYRADRALYAAKQGGRNRVCLDAGETQDEKGC